MSKDSINQLLRELPNTEKMPVLFVGHGNPMNAIEDNVFSREMKRVGKSLPIPKAILMISAHWETRGVQLTAQSNPPTIHDFGGFPKELYEVQYPAPGSEWLCKEFSNIETNVKLSHDWGLDHGCWSVTKNMFPKANIPIVQLSLDVNKSPSEHYTLGKTLNELRNKGVMIIGSGNIIHNFSYLSLKGTDFNSPNAHEWAQIAEKKFKQLIIEDNHQALCNYNSLGKEIQLSVPTAEHYLPLLYVLSQKSKSDTVSFFNETTIAGSFSMTSLVLS